MVYPESPYLAPVLLQGWTLYRVFDSKVELSESEEEVAYEASAGIDLDGEGTRAIMNLG